MQVGDCCQAAGPLDLHGGTIRKTRDARAAGEGPSFHKEQITGTGGGDVTNILWVILVIVLAVWLIGLLADVADNVIHVLLVVGLLILAYNVITGRRSI